MKYLKIAHILILAFGMVMLFSACGETKSSENHDAQSEEHADGHDHDHEHGHDGDAAVHGEGKAYTSAFVCVMHCEGSGSEVAGDCPVCGMTYVALNDHVSDGHSHE